MNCDYIAARLKWSEAIWMFPGALMSSITVYMYRCYFKIANVWSCGSEKEEGNQLISKDDLLSQL